MACRPQPFTLLLGGGERGGRKVFHRVNRTSREEVISSRNASRRFPPSASVRECVVSDTFDFNVYSQRAGERLSRLHLGKSHARRGLRDDENVKTAAARRDAVGSTTI